MIERIKMITFVDFFTDLGGFIVTVVPLLVSVYVKVQLNKKNRETEKDIKKTAIIRRKKTFADGFFSWYATYVLLEFASIQFLPERIALGLLALYWLVLVSSLVYSFVFWVAVDYIKNM